MKRPALAALVAAAGVAAWEAQRRRDLRAITGDPAWWELRDEDTALRGERTGATLRLGDHIRVQVARVDASRGRVDLLAAQIPGAQG